MGRFMSSCRKSLRMWMCNRLGWHNVNENTKLEYDGASFKSTCKHCGKPVLMDSQGNWFTIF